MIGYNPENRPVRTENGCPLEETGLDFKSKASDRQVGGSHYKDYKIQPWEFFQVNEIPFHKADIIKRILRFDKPTGKGREDLDKIRHELDLIEQYQV